MIETSEHKIVNPTLPSELPTDLQGLTIEIKKLLAGAFGKFGQETDIKYFKAKNMNECSKEIFWVRYDGERYDFKTPIPGCK